MRAEAVQLKKLYDTLNKAYVIPDYQRPFAWSAEKAADLLDSILEGAQSHLPLTSLGTFLFCPVPTSKGHPFGSGAATSSAPSTIWEVVDGQQRLTVLALIGRALYERLEELKSAGLVYSPPAEFELMYSTYRTMKGAPVPLLIRDGDNYDSGLKSDISRLLSSFSGGGSQPVVGEQLTIVLERIREWISSKLDCTNFKEFSDYLLNGCQCIQVEADDQDTAFAMFEPLNSTSEPLTAFEVFRSKVVRALPTENLHACERLLDYTNRERDEVIKRSNNLVFTTAQAYSGERPRVHFVQLKRYLDGQVDRSFVRSIGRAADFHREVWIEQTHSAAWFDDETRNAVRFLKASKHDVAVPLLLRYFLTDPQRLPSVTKAAVAFYSLWRAVAPTNKLPEIYRDLFRTKSPDNMALAGGTLKTPQDLAAYFRNQLALKYGPPPPGGTLKDLWLKDGFVKFLSYETLRTVCRLFIFVDMGASIKSNLVPNDPWTNLDDIEHIFPRGAAGAPDNVDAVGNLTFLPSEVNQSIQDADWSDRRELYRLLASPTKPCPAPTTYSSGRALPAAVLKYLTSGHGSALGHLEPLSRNPNWGQKEIAARSTQMLGRVWRVLYEQWLNP